MTLATGLEALTHLLDKMSGIMIDQHRRIEKLEHQLLDATSHIGLRDRVKNLEASMDHAKNSIEDIGDTLCDLHDNTLPDIKGDIRSLQADVRSIQRGDP
jgi:CII-binding regulator of phage lambda lysogenization HflD